MIGWLFLLFTVVPALELYLLLQLGAAMGALNTFLLVVFTGVVGAWLARREGTGVLLQMQQDLQSGTPPAARITEGVLVLVGGLLLVTPGLLTDLTGFALIVPVTRQLLAPLILAWLARRVNVQMVGGPGFEVPPGDFGGEAEPRVRVRQGPRPAVSDDSDSPFSNKFDDLP
ncbi:MAG: FxsA family protein [Myxococcales bacterium]|nr:FxsA family protein [Myxococcales bacterium]